MIASAPQPHITLRPTGDFVLMKDAAERLSRLDGFAALEGSLERFFKRLFEILQNLGSVVADGDMQPAGAGNFELAVALQLSDSDRVFLSAIRAGDFQRAVSHLEAPSVVSTTSEDGDSGDSSIGGYPFMIAGLTAQQSAVLEFIRAEHAAGRPSPSYKEIAAHIGVRSKGNVARIVASLIRRQRLVRPVVEHFCPRCGYRIGEPTRDSPPTAHAGKPGSGRNDSSTAPGWTTGGIGP